MSSVAVRAAPVLAATVTLTVPDPIPVAGFTLTHEVSAAASDPDVGLMPAVHPHVEALAVTATRPVPPVAATGNEVAERL
jgi:hypothetical protein